MWLWHWRKVSSLVTWTDSSRRRNEVWLERIRGWIINCAISNAQWSTLNVSASSHGRLICWFEYSIFIWRKQTLGLGGPGAFDQKLLCLYVILFIYQHTGNRVCLCHCVCHWNVGIYDIRIWIYAWDIHGIR